MSLLYFDPGDHCCGGHDHRKIFYPPQKLGECSVCKSEDSGGHKYLCSRCGERNYCSAECQKKDWAEHKKKCGTTDRVELGSFYAFLAFLNAFAHTGFFPPHFALLHRVANDPHHQASPITLPDGWSGKLVEVNDRDETLSWAPPNEPVAEGSNIRSWYPRTSDEVYARKLYRRILWSQHVLPILTAIANAILAEMYTTTSDDTKKYRRVRLRYRSSPIADFGIASGSAEVTPEDRLIFKRLSDGSIVRGQDPEDHYWLWFRTVRGEEFTLDMSMFPFSFGVMVDLTGHVPTGMEGMFDSVPAYFEERELQKQLQISPFQAQLLKERHRVSVLYSDDLANTISHSYDYVNCASNEVDGFRNFMSRVSGRPIPETEAMQAYKLSRTILQPLMENNLRTRAWTKAPMVPRTAIYHDPGEAEHFDEEAEAFAELIRSMKKAGIRHRSQRDQRDTRASRGN